MIHLLTRLFPLWAILLSVTAFFFPGPFAGLRPAIIPLLSVVMFCMGMTLKWSDFKETIKSPKIILIGVLLQYVVMPLSAFLISRSFGLSPEFIAGMVLVGSSAGGTASNVICYLARGNVALSITLTMASTLVAVFAMPALSLLYLHQI
ncbi:MAG: bile acid:sodium symporter family protein, partial [Candidatus Scalindua sp.]|nr:bile acid:sodium symporter family protein [Candidatus Scalindua sp.]